MIIDLIVYFIYENEVNSCYYTVGGAVEGRVAQTKQEVAMLASPCSGAYGSTGF